jgi:hypothetical protein
MYITHLALLERSGRRESQDGGEAGPQEHSFAYNTIMQMQFNSLFSLP